MSVMNRLGNRTRRTPFDHVPFENPGVPDISSVPSFLFWLGRKQWWIILSGTFFGIISFCALAIMPRFLGNAIQSITEKDSASVQRWALTIIALGTVQSFSGLFRHRRALGGWIVTATRLQQIIARKAAQLGADLPRLVSTGEVVAVNSNDVERVARGYDMIPRLIGAIVSFIVVATMLISASPTIGLMVTIGVPVMAVGIAPIIKPLQARETEQRRRLSIVSSLAADTVAGLRVLRGIGGEDAFVARFEKASQDVRAAAVRTARMRSFLEGLQVILPGALILGVITLGGSMVQKGSMQVGELLSFYGYSAFLVLPLKVMTESAQRLTSAVVSARRVIHLLTIEPINLWGSEKTLSADATLLDQQTGVEIQPGESIGVVSDDSIIADDLCDRLGGYVNANRVLFGGKPLSSYTREFIRQSIYAHEKDPAILSGTIGSIFAVPHSGRLTIQDALDAASGQDIIDSLEGEGLGAEVVERGRTLSGGQRQRLALARTLFVDAQIAILDDPTSAVDAHTEVRIAKRALEIRQGLSTLILTTSPLILDRVTRVILLVNGEVVDQGTHLELLERSAKYRELVIRGS
ncbi:MAG: ATP-binding cassette domain-containing protein [Actinobacteria bacterium]|uniref:Unannotated protein n=1 Tax=freshwater metagenome TaxID=449393 RepID=A0A6J7CNY8_9ZZZZ|nr:ATP-binding cassette domain-containing protein [Actinomycetota bacterium]MSX24423.1 ATP-binding cassette domain-containing protein [Actinomycetota bacterium]MSY46022.1 ATP-binding cassette domain-containing protein [Actinomycetota bacterium]MSY57061.1 ATP-binding cassette domain-containing protein [Actinomycetota bacterium]MTB00107.1 ATP-binding cassette domain-containing protein [Actinomycetota bacterium]